MTKCGNFNFTRDLTQPLAHNSTAGCGKELASGFLKIIQDVKPDFVTHGGFGPVRTYPTSKTPLYMAICKDCNALQGRFENYKQFGNMKEYKSAQTQF